MFFAKEEKDHARQRKLARQAALRRDKVNLDDVRDVIVLGDWYRDALGRFKTTANGGGLQNLTICKPWCEKWAILERHASIRSREYAWPLGLRS